jgi:predicted permease
MATIFIRLVAVFLMIFMGVAARRRKLLDSDTTRRLALLVTNLFYPALIYSTLVSTFSLSELATHWMLPAGTLLIMLTGFAVGLPAAALLRFRDDRQKRAFHFQCTINNYVFLPMPLILIYWGNQGVGNLVLTTVGSELAVWTFGVIALTGHGFKLRSLKHLLSMPMAAIAAAAVTMCAAHAGVGAHLAGVPAELRDAVLSVLDIFGKATVPLAMMVAGSRMTELRPRHLFTVPQVGVIALRLLLIPACAVALLHLLPFPTDTRNVLIVVAVMPSAIASVMLSDIYNADSEFAASAVLTTHAVSLITIPVWLALAL